MKKFIRGGVIFIFSICFVMPVFATTIGTDISVSGNLTAANATTTNLFTTTASSTNLFGAGLLTCNTSGSSALIWNGGKFGCNTIASGGNSLLLYDNVNNDYYTGTSTAGLLATASSTIGNGTQAGGLTISGGATTTGQFIIDSSVYPQFQVFDSVAGFQIHPWAGLNYVDLDPTVSGAGIFLGDNQSATFWSFVSGNVGIGTITPHAKLDINSTSTIIEQSNTPSSSSAACVTGSISWDSNYVYVCVGTNTWKRSTLATW